MIDGFERAVTAAGDRTKWAATVTAVGRQRFNRRSRIAPSMRRCAARSRPSSGSSFARAGRIGERIGRLGYAPLGIRREVVERQLAAALPELERERDRAHRARGVWPSRPHEHRDGDASVVSAPPRSSICSRRCTDGTSSRSGWRAAKGLIVVTGHLGNWELGGAYLAARGLPIDAVARHMANPLFDRYLTSTRQRIGMTVVHDEDAVRACRDRCAAGARWRFSSIRARSGLASTWVPFFGRYAKTPRGPAVFALRLGAPIVFGVALRQPSGRYHARRSSRST